MTREFLWSPKTFPDCLVNKGNLAASSNIVILEHALFTSPYYFGLSFLLVTVAFLLLVHRFLHSYSLNGMSLLQLGIRNVRKFLGFKITKYVMTSFGFSVIFQAKHIMKLPHIFWMKSYIVCEINHQISIWLLVHTVVCRHVFFFGSTFWFCGNIFYERIVWL